MYAIRRLALVVTLVLLGALGVKAQGLANVSGNLKSLTGLNVTQQNTYVTFQLYNFGSSIPRVIPTNVIVAQQSPPFQPDGSGNISGTIQENNTITPANTFYRVCVYFQGTAPQCDNYLINANFNLNNATPLMSVPPPVNPLYGTTLTSICQPTTPPVPDTGNDVLYCLETDNNYYYEDSTGRVVGPLSSGGDGGGGMPAGSTSQVQYNSNGVLAGAAGVMTNGNSLSIKGPIPYRDVTAYMPAGGCDNTAGDFIFRYGTINATTTSLAISSNNNFRNGCGVFVAGAGATSTLLTPGQGAASNPVVIGGTGSTTVHYKVAAIDANYGLSVASSAITVTTAPSTRTALNYVGIFWTNVANAVGYLVYTDQTGGGTYVPLGYSFDCAGFAAGTVCGAIDKGVETNTWTVYPMWPQTPPASNTNQALITTIVSGAGTLNLTLAAPASNSVTNSFTMPDNAPFFKAAISDASNDGATFDKGTVFIPNGLWFSSTLPFPSTGTAGINFLLSGQLQIFGLPIMGPLSGGANNTGFVSFEGHGGLYKGNDWPLPCANIYGYPSLGAVFLVSNGKLSLKNICLTTWEAGIISAPGSISTREVSFSNVGSGPSLQVDNNSFFSLFDRTNWNTSTFNPIWLLGLTNNSHSSEFDFRDNSFISHGIKYDQVFPSPGYFGNIVFDGLNDIEDNLDPGFINVTSNGASLLNVTADNLNTGDAMVTQYVIYPYLATEGMPSVNFTIHGQSVGFAGLLPSNISAGNPANCRAWTYENSNSGSSSTPSESIGYYGNMFGTYTGCDLGITTTGYDVQSTEFLASGGNDALGPAGEQIIGHVFRRPQTTLTPGSGSLNAGTYYIQVTMLDVANRESAPSPEMSATVGASASIAVSAATDIYFPASCKVYFGTTPGGEANYFASSTVTNGTCTYTLTTTSGETAGVPVPVGNAMRSWLTAENNGNSCLFCGTSNAGTGFLGAFLTGAQYATAAGIGGPGLFLGGTTAPVGVFDAHASLKSFPVTMGTTAAIPATCTFTAGSLMQMYIATDATAGQNWYYCTATNTWTQQLNSSSASTAYSAITSATNTSAAMVCGTGCSITTSGGGTNVATSAASATVAATATNVAYSGVTSSTNTSAAMVCATGCSIGVSGSGTNYATSLLGNTWANPAALGTGTPAAVNATTINATGNVTLSGLLTSGTIAYSLCSDASGHIILTLAANCYAASGTVSGLTAGYIPLAGSATTITANSHCDDGITTASTITCTEAFAAPTGAFGGGASSLGSTASGGWGGVESANTGYTPTSSQDYMRADSTLHAFVCSINGAAEPGCTFGAPTQVNANALATTSADSFQAFNNTASTSGTAVQISPSFHWRGHVWNTTSVAADNCTDWVQYVLPTSNTNPYSTMTWKARTGASCAAPSSTVMSVDQFGDLGLAGSFNATAMKNTANGDLLISFTAPTIASGFNTSGYSVAANNGPSSFLVTVGTGSGTSTGVLTLPAATAGWNCFASNRSRADAIIQTSADNTTSVTLTNFGVGFSATNFTNSDSIQVSCFAH